MRYKLEHRLGIKAPAHVVWEIVSDLSTWHEWNPLYTQAKGVVGFGELLTLTLALPGQKPRVIRPRVLDWAPDEAIHWKLSMLMGLVDTTRYLEIEKMSDTGCIFSNGEIFDGPLGPMVAKRMKRAIREGFAAMGEALRDRAEARWRAVSGEPTSAA
jgi:hypothetical protein